MIRAFLFDLDGTLVDSLVDIAASMNAALAEADWPEQPLAFFQGTIGVGAEALANLIAPRDVAIDDPRRVTLLGRYQAIYAERLTHSTRPYPGVVELVATLRARGLPLAVVSNKPDEATRRIVDELFPRDSFAFVRGHQAGAPRKPDPSVALAVAASLGVAPRVTAFVGDTSIDMQTARAAGMVAVGVGWGYRPDELRAHGAAYVVDEPAQVSALMA